MDARVPGNDNGSARADFVALESGSVALVSECDECGHREFIDGHDLRAVYAGDGGPHCDDCDWFMSLIGYRPHAEATPADTASVVIT